MNEEFFSVVEVGDRIEAIFPDGDIEEGTVIKYEDRLVLDEDGKGHHFLDGGFPDGTEFRFICDCDADEEQLAVDELEGIDE